MGQIKNIKLHIVTDIKYLKFTHNDKNRNIFNNNGYNFPRWQLCASHQNRQTDDQGRRVRIGVERQRTMYEVPRTSTGQVLVLHYKILYEVHCKRETIPCGVPQGRPDSPHTGPMFAVPRSSPT